MTWIPRGLIAFVILVVVIFVLNALNLIHIHGSVSI